MRIKVRVIPNSKVEILQKLGNAEYRLKVREKALEGQANTAVKSALAAHFKVKGSDVSIIKGVNSRDKIVDINGISNE